MKKRTLLLAFLLFSFSVLCVRVSAQTSYASVSGDRFLCRAFSSENAQLTAGEDGTLEMSFRRVAPTVSADMETVKRDFPSNAIRIVLTNNSSCTSFVLTYQYPDSQGLNQTGSEKLTLGTRGVRSDYYVFTDMADRVTRVSLTFSGIATGSVTISSLDVFSLCDDMDDACGALTECSYNREENSIRVRGNIQYHIMTENRKAKIALYAVGAGQSIPYREKALDTVPMSSSFDFTVPVTSQEQRFSGYVVAIINDAGRILYQFSPRIPCTVPDEASETPFLKGVHTDIGILAAQANAGLSVVDVDISKLGSEAGNGYMYTFEGKYTYFDRNYVASIDSRVKTAYENGMAVYLRLTAPIDSGTGLSGILADSPEKVTRLYVQTAFLCSRYQSVSRGVVSGIVFGTVADSVDKPPVSLEEYTRLYADSLFAVHEAAGSCAIRLVVPVSDVSDDGKEVNAGRYSPRVFLDSLVRCLSGRYTGSIGFSVMPQLHGVPGGNPGTLGWADIGSFAQYLGALHKSYPVISERFLLWWEPTPGETHELLTASLVFGYYAAVNCTGADGFILSTALLSDIPLTQELFGVIRYIDTQRTGEYGASALEILGLRNWTEVIPSYSEGKPVTTEYRECTDPESPPFRFLGEAYLWDFTGIANDYGWSAGDGCDSIMMEKNEETNRALAARMTPATGLNYTSELIYRFDEPLLYAGVDTLSFALQIDAPQGAYTVTIQICTEQAVCETRAVLESGKLTVLYVNSAGLTNYQKIKCIRIFSAPASGRTEPYKLSVGSVSAHSTTVYGEKLAEIIRDAKKQQESTTVQSTEGLKTAWIYVIVLIAFVSVIIVITLVFRNDEDEDGDKDKKRDS